MDKERKPIDHGRQRPLSMGLVECCPLGYVRLDSIPEVVCNSEGVGISGSAGDVGWLVCRYFLWPLSPFLCRRGTVFAG